MMRRSRDRLRKATQLRRKLIHVSRAKKRITVFLWRKKLCPQNHDAYWTGDRAAKLQFLVGPPKVNRKCSRLRPHEHEINGLLVDALWFMELSTYYPQFTPTRFQNVRISA